jgi:hypothetical protein
MSNTIMFKILKYIFLPFFIIVFFAALMGRERLANFFIGDPSSLLEEYLLVSSLLILYDVYRTIANKFYR